MHYVVIPLHIAAVAAPHRSRGTEASINVSLHTSQPLNGVTALVMLFPCSCQRLSLTTLPTQDLHQSEESRQQTYISILHFTKQITYIFVCVSLKCAPAPLRPGKLHWERCLVKGAAHAELLERAKRVMRPSAGPRKHQPGALAQNPRVNIKPGALAQDPRQHQPRSPSQCHNCARPCKHQPLRTRPWANAKLQPNCDNSIGKRGERQGNQLQQASH
jgi:hypothetical protein